ncbi:hypothetical protein FA15DRAFT_603630 [Coprinopsis marcescibilis]|uniref:Uncharacterized protein n=1 Tax=Coprinopsis marcescibilis TaxID=230819 RepID=A0A5C3KDU0_COPMA|nr:hypothetical protein FA15DRAFT_603630 [Coprinopsis marcescibilis]
MEHRLRNWIELNRPDIQDAAVCALKLHEKPDNVLTHLLLITLTPSFKPREKSVDPRRAFTIQLLQPALISKQVPRDRGNVEGIAALMTKSNEWRKKGYVGLVIMMIMVTEPLTMAHISPFGLQDVKDVPYDPEWKANLTRKTSALPEWILPMSCDADEAL